MEKLPRERGEASIGGPGTLSKDEPPILPAVPTPARRRAGDGCDRHAASKSLLKWGQIPDRAVTVVTNARLPAKPSDATLIPQDQHRRNGVRMAILRPYARRA